MTPIHDLILMIVGSIGIAGVASWIGWTSYDFTEHTKRRAKWLFTGDEKARRFILDK